MKIYIGDGKKLVDYSLPNKIEGSFFINYVSSSGVSESIVLKASENADHWVIYNDLEMKIVNSVMEKFELIDEGYCVINFSDLEESIFLYYSNNYASFFEFTRGNNLKLGVGKNVNNTIVFDNRNMMDNQLEIVFNDGFWKLQSLSDNSYIYVNGVRISSKILDMGDMIFVYGLKIIWMENFVLINNPNNSVSTSLNPANKVDFSIATSKITPVKDTEKGILLYDDNQIFFHTPIRKQYFENKVIEITPPPSKYEDDSPPILLSIGGTMMMGVSSSLTGIIAVFSILKGESVLSSVFEIIICLSMIGATVLFPYLLDKFQRNRIAKKENKRQKKYTEYLEKKRLHITEIMKKEKDVIYANNLSVNELMEVVNNLDNRVWSREISDVDFLSLRLGIGSKNSTLVVKSNIDDFSIDDDNLKDEVVKIIESEYILSDVPITVSLLDNRVLPFVIHDDFSKKWEFIYAVLLQLITYCSGSDLKIVILTSSVDSEKWDSVKYLAHCHSDDYEVQFFATDENEMKEISDFMDKIYQERLDSLEENKKDQKNSFDEKKVYTRFKPYYLIITDDYINAKKISIIDKIVNSSINLGFSLLMIEPTMQNIPSKCNVFVDFKKDICSLLGKDLSKSDNLAFVPENFEGDIKKYIEVISNIPVVNINKLNLLPKVIDFLEMYRVGKIEQLNVLNRWEKNDPTKSLKAPVGVHPDGKLFDLDLHEKYHGPHGLIAGSTGSGKSEFIITYILSLAINFHPDEVQFVLIDYKGGGLAGAFENRESGIKLPHLVGTITNLDVNEMNRTLVSINSELKRRQRIFNEARNITSESTIDIYKYQRLYREGKVKEPISHLFIISDEFAELKSQQPDFMDELISTARIGRSLGVHLILATQKPSGVVDDQIWSNSRFKVALKVATDEDSRELLKRDEAAKIKETGRFYLQVGYDEYFEIGQSAWTGARYIPMDRVNKNIDDSIVFVNNTGNKTRIIKDDSNKNITNDYGDQLTNTVKFLYNLALEEGLVFKNLWLPSIPKNIYLKNIIDKYNYKARKNVIEAILGEYDAPIIQFQNILTYNLNTCGNVIIYGNAGSGKENLLQTIVYSISIYHGENEVNFYILDFGSETLKVFTGFPQVGDVILTDEKLKVKSLLLFIEREMNRRKELFSNYGGSYNEYIQNSNEEVPFIVFILNGYENFVETYGDYDDFYSHLVRECIKYGIVVIMTVVNPGAIPSRLKQAFGNNIMLQVTDEFNYEYIMDAPRNLKPMKCFGRGLADCDDNVYEFQSLLIYKKNEINDVIKSTGDKLMGISKKAKAVPVLPEVITSEILLSYVNTLSDLPIGFNIDTANVSRFNFKKGVLNRVLGNNILTDVTYINEFIRLLTIVPGIEVTVVDFSGTLEEVDGILLYNSDFTDSINAIREEVNSISKCVYLFVGIGYIYDRVLDEGIDALRDLFENIENDDNNFYLLLDNYTSYKRTSDEFWNSFIEKNNGIWVGKAFLEQEEIICNKKYKYDGNESFKGLSYVVKDGEYEVIKDFSAGLKEGLYE